MANVGTGPSGYPLTATGVLSGSTYAALGTNSGLTSKGIVIAQGNSPFQASAAGTSGQVVIGATGANPAFGTITSGDGSITFATGANSLAMSVTGGTSVGKTITGDSGGALSPTAGNWNVLGLSGSKVSGASSTLTVKSPPFSQVGSSATSSLNTGEFVTAAVTRTLPASAGLADGDLIMFVCTTAGALVVQSVTAQKIRIGNLISSAAGSATSTAIGDVLALRFNATDGFWYAVSSVGNWTIS